MLQGSFTGELVEAGVDEAGRGCLAGPVFAAAVILPADYRDEELNDSKQLTALKRERLRKTIEQDALAWAVGSISPGIIDEINILNASILAMHDAIHKLKLKPEFILVDGNRFKPVNNIRHQCIIKGDTKFMSIAAASILAKTYRDEYMTMIGQEFPQYDWKNNKGYPCRKHRNAIYQFGPCIYHRMSFRLYEQLKLEL
ncbi:MAG: ribonuclease HII [Bacteroidetes bacterium]|nr:ribonuclease HII [Bacteroidota bacterium]